MQLLNFVAISASSASEPFTAWTSPTSYVALACSCGVLPVSLSVSSSSSSGALFSHGSVPISLYVTTTTRFLDAPVSQCQGRMGATPLRMAEQHETRSDFDGTMSDLDGTLGNGYTQGVGGMDFPTYAPPMPAICTARMSRKQCNKQRKASQSKSSFSLLLKTGCASLWLVRPRIVFVARQMLRKVLCKRARAMATAMARVIAFCFGGKS